VKEKRKALKIAFIFSPVKMRRQPAIFPLSVEYLSPTQFLGSVITKTRTNWDLCSLLVWLFYLPLYKTFWLGCILFEPKVSSIAFLVFELFVLIFLFDLFLLFISFAAVRCRLHLKSDYFAYFMGRFASFSSAVFATSF